MKGVFGLPDSLLRDSSGQLIGMSIVHVVDMLLATNNSHQAESHISRLLSKCDIKDMKRADDDGGVLFRGKRVRTVPDDMKPDVCPCDKTRRSLRKLVANLPACLEPEPDKREPSVQEAKSKRCEGTRRDESFATSQLQRKTISVPGVRSLARRPNHKTLEGPAGNWFEV